MSSLPRAGAAGGGPPAPASAAGGPAGAASAEVGLLNIANALTIMRLALVPVFVAFLFAGDGDGHGWRVAAFAAYAVAAVTDQVDGYLARSRGIVTDFGAFVDPVADKALTGAALVSLSVLGELPWAVTVVVALREVGITLLRLWVIRHGVIAASRGGKMKTLFLNIALGLYVLPLAGAAASARAVVLAVGVALALVTGADYVYRALALRRRAATAQGGRHDGRSQGDPGNRDAVSPEYAAAEDHSRSISAPARSSASLRDPSGPPARASGSPVRVDTVNATAEDPAAPGSAAS